MENNYEPLEKQNVNQVCQKRMEIMSRLNTRQLDLNVAIARGEKPKVPYTLEDMVYDAVGILDVLKIEKARICGASMGG
ncbi:MAG: Lipase/esterase [Promethearchaeota archaeon CR_4]|nr:MAG: Lipase/esterase [Candidatus Lokiarchaeota archaeon CR_4]